MKNRLGTAVTPYQDKDRSKKEQVAEMFDNIAPKYDFLNHMLSMGIDIRWRRKAIKLLASIKPEKVLDIATGTGDFAIEALKLNPKEIIGVDISRQMLKVGSEKMKEKGLDQMIRLEYGDSENLQFEDNYFDAITVGFGVRNFENLQKGLEEMNRVLRKGGKAMVLEPAIPRSFPLKQLYMIYFKGILPLIGRLVSKDRRAYTYLPESVKAFPEKDAFLKVCKKAGFEKAGYKSLTFGICVLYILEK